MLEQVNEKIDVLVAFRKKGEVLPLSFDWDNRKYCVNKVNLVHSEKKGSNKWYHFSVSSNESYFKLGFDTGNHAWVLEEAYLA
jgi:hypothetical protein